MKKHLIVLSGKARHGKDTVAEIIEANFSKENIFKIAFADKLKEICYSLGWNGEKDEKGRTFLQESSIPIKNYHGIDYFAQCVKNKVLENDAEISIVTDARHKYEAYTMAELSDKYEVILIRVIRPETEDWSSPLSKEQQQDISEVDMDDYNGLLHMNIVLNDGTLEDLQEKVLSLLSTHGLNKKEA